MDTIKLGSLSDSGWISSSTELADQIFSHLFLSDYNQTSLFPNNVTSIAYIVQKNLNDKLSLIGDLKLCLSSYFSKYFNNVEVEVKEVESRIEDGTISISIMVTMDDDQGKVINLGKLFTTNGIKITKITTLINEGV